MCLEGLDLMVWFWNGGEMCAELCPGDLRWALISYTPIEEYLCNIPGEAADAFPVEWMQN